MGKGDKKSRRGKIILGSYGVRRPRKNTPKFVSAPAPVQEAKKSAEPVAVVSIEQVTDNPVVRKPTRKAAASEAPVKDARPKRTKKEPPTA